MLHHQLRQSVDGLRGNKPLLVLGLCIQMTEERRYEGIIQTIPSVSDSRLRLRLLMWLVMMLVMMMIKLMKV